MKSVTVTVVIPTYMEEKYINECMKSILLQTYPKENMEIFFVDGNSNDKTVEIIMRYQDRYPLLINVLNNPKRTQACAMNIGIKAANGKYIIRMDAHAEYDSSYIQKCVEYLDKMDIVNVGGIAETKGRTEFGKIIAKMMSSKFGVGNSQFRINGKSGYVDTVPFGAFRKSFFESYGGFDERFDRNEDNEINYRIHRTGGKIYLANDIRFTYFCRDTFSEILNMAYQNGKWNVYTMYKVPGSMRVRHFVPLSFLLSLIGLSIGCIITKTALPILIIDSGSYLLCDIYFSLKASDERNEFIHLLKLFPAFHLTYGAGSLVGIWKLICHK